jgi:hypothetical protein
METAEKPEDGSKFRTRTAKLRSELERLDRVESAIAGVLKSFRDNNIDLPLFLDYISYSDHPAVKTSSLSNSVLAARTALLYSNELPGILRRWHSRPTQHGKGMSSDTPGRRTMQAFAIDRVNQTIHRELDDCEDLFRMKTSQLSRDTLLSIRIDRLQAEVIQRAPVTWEIYRNAAWTSQQEKRNTLKSPDKVRDLVMLHR